MGAGCEQGGGIVLASSDEVEVAGDACIVITEDAFPVWNATSVLFGSAQAPAEYDWPLAFHATQGSCNDLDFDGQIIADWTSVPIPVSDECPVYIQLLGQAEPRLEVRWFPE